MDNTAKISRTTVISALSMWIIVAIVKFCIDETTETRQDIHYLDYNEIITSQTLNAALAENATEYCIFNAIPRGFQLETLEDFCNEHKIELNIIPVKNELSAQKLMSEGKCDIIVRHTFLTDSTMSKPLLKSNLVILSSTTFLLASLFFPISETKFVVWLFNATFKEASVVLVISEKFKNEFFISIEFKKSYKLFKP